MEEPLLVGKLTKYRGTPLLDKPICLVASKGSKHLLVAVDQFQSIFWEWFYTRNQPWCNNSVDLYVLSDRWSDVAVVVVVVAASVVLLVAMALWLVKLPFS